MERSPGGLLDSALLVPLMLPFSAGHLHTGAEARRLRTDLWHGNRHR